MPKPPLPPELDEFLTKPNPAVMATLNGRGEPHTAATWYLWEDGRVLVNMDASRRRLGYLRADPRVSLTVLDGEDWYTHVTLSGRVGEIVDDHGLADIDRLARQYRGAPYRNRERPRVSAWIEIQRWHAWGRYG
jgi:PPOX class probable F420-dependent enzyme